jgi:hypothetical protein
MRCWPGRSSWPAAPLVPASVTVWPEPKLIAGVARQPEALTRLYTPFFITVSLVEATFFINVAFMALFVFATPGL